MKLENILEITFMTKREKFAFRKIEYGINKVPSTFQRALYLNQW